MEQSDILPQETTLISLYKLGELCEARLGPQARAELIAFATRGDIKDYQLVESFLLERSDLVSLELKAKLARHKEEKHAN